MVIDLYKIIKQTLEELDALAPDETGGHVHAVSEFVAEMDAPFAIVDSLSAVPETETLKGGAWTDEVLEIGIESADLEECIQIAEDAAEALESLGGTTTADGKTIIMVECSRTEPDAIDMATELMRRPLRVKMRWYKD